MIYKSRYWCIVLSIFSFFGNIDLWDNTSITNIMKWVFISIFFSFILSLLTASKKCWLRTSGIILCSLQLLLCLVNFFSYETWGFGFNERLLTILLETNSREVYEFLLSFSQLLFSFILGHGIIIMIVCLTLSLMIMRYIPLKLYISLILFLVPIGSVITITHVLTSEIGKRDVLMLGKTTLFLKNSFEMRSMYMDEKEGLLSYSPLKNKTVITDDQVDNIVLIIGESSCPRHWQLYGYSLPTTPELNRKKDCLIIFTDVLPPYSSTSSSLQCVLTTKPSMSDRPWYHYVNLLSLSKAAGFKVFWYSNQEKISEFGASVGVISGLADYTHYQDSLSVSSIIGKRAYDEVLVKHMCDALKDTTKHKLIVLHTMGSHSEYEYRYPKTVQRFSSKDIHRSDLKENQREVVAHYDNSIYYTDKVLSSVIDSLSLSSGRNLMLYLSDHSEDVYETGDVYRHAFKGGDLVKIPMVMWLSTSYMTNNHELTKLIQEKNNMPIASENIIYTIMNIMGIRDDIYDSQYDFLSPDYSCKVRYFDGKPFE